MGTVHKHPRLEPTRPIPPTKTPPADYVVKLEFELLDDPVPQVPEYAPIPRALIFAFGFVLGWGLTALSGYWS